MALHRLLIGLSLALSPHPVAGAQHARDSKSATQPSSFRDCSDCIEMVHVPAGTFVMGAAEGDAKGFMMEGPQHAVHIKHFAVSKFDVTRGEWSDFVQATSRPTGNGCAYSDLPKEERPKASWQHLGFTQDDTHPVVCVTFRDAIDYTAWLSKKTGHVYRLLSESEWEYAARAGSKTAFSWGTMATHESANYGGNQPGPGLAQGRDQWVGTSPVGSFASNAFGLYDMSGNVMQWVQDCLSNDYVDTPKDGAAFVSDSTITGVAASLDWLNGTSACSYRMVRGGDWGDPPSMIRSAFRNFAPSKGQTLETYRSAGLGFRVAREE